MVAPIFKPGNDQGLVRQIARRLRFFGGTGGKQHSVLEAPEGYAFVSSRNGSFLASNAYYDGSNWHRYDTAQPASLIVPFVSGPIQVQRAAAGANPIVWTGGAMGSSQRAVAVANTAIPAAANTAIFGSIALQPGHYLLLGWSNILMGAAAGTCDIWLATAALATVSGADSFSFPAGASKRLLAYGVVSPAVATSYLLMARSTAAATARWAAGAAGFGTEMGLEAIREG